MARFNPPPNWPAPPEGWVPPDGWQPDPAWGPAPPGWQLWTPEPGDRGRPNSDAFLRTGAVALVVWAVISLVMVLVGSFSAVTFGEAFGRSLIPWLVVSLIAFFRKKRWSWAAYIGVFLGVYLVFTALSLAGQQSGTS